MHAPRAGVGVYGRNPAPARKAAGLAAGGPWAVAEGAGGPGGGRVTIDQSFRPSSLSPLTKQEAGPSSWKTRALSPFWNWVLPISAAPLPWPNGFRSGVLQPKGSLSPFPNMRSSPLVPQLLGNSAPQILSAGPVPLKSLVLPHSEIQLQTLGLWALSREHTRLREINFFLLSL